MEISLTLFNSIFDNKTNQKLTFENFDSFEKALYGLSNRAMKSKKDAPLMSPAQYKPNTTRANDNVTMWSAWCAVDVDDFEFNGDLHAAIDNKFIGTRFVCYSTASSTHSVPKFRLVFPLPKQSKLKKFDTFGFLSKQPLEIWEISKPKTFLGCIIYQQNIVMLIILFLVVLGIILILIS